MSPLLNLPAEIRLIILGHAFSDDDEVHVTMGGQEPCWQPLSIMLSCKTLFYDFTVFAPKWSPLYVVSDAQVLHAKALKKLSKWCTIKKLEFRPWSATLLDSDGQSIKANWAEEVSIDDLPWLNAFSYPQWHRLMPVDSLTSVSISMTPIPGNILKNRTDAWAAFVLYLSESRKIPAMAETMLRDISARMLKPKAKKNRDRQVTLEVTGIVKGSRVSINPSLFGPKSRKGESSTLTVSNNHFRRPIVATWTWQQVLNVADERAVQDSAAKARLITIKQTLRTLFVSNPAVQADFIHSMTDYPLRTMRAYLSFIHRAAQANFLPTQSTPRDGKHAIVGIGMNTMQRLAESFNSDVTQTGDIFIWSLKGEGKVVQKKKKDSTPDVSQVDQAVFDTMWSLSDHVEMESWMWLNLAS